MEEREKSLVSSVFPLVTRSTNYRFACLSPHALISHSLSPPIFQPLKHHYNYRQMGRIVATKRHKIHVYVVFFLLLPVACDGRRDACVCVRVSRSLVCREMRGKAEEKAFSSVMSCVSCRCKSGASDSHVDAERNTKSSARQQQLVPTLVPPVGCSSDAEDLDSSV